MAGRKIYHLMIDRFFPSGTVDSTGNFKGGTIMDIIRHLDYIHGLGMSGIMLTPFFKSAAYHGYHTISFDEVDPHFGTWDDIACLIAEVHRRGMIIVADFVANHCHSSSSLFTENCNSDWFLRDSDGKYICYAGISELPMFDTNNPEVSDFLTDKAEHLCRMGFDALRLDHAAGPSFEFWEKFRTKIKRNYPNVELIGEVWGSLDFCPRKKLRFACNKLLFGAQEARQMEYVGVLDGVLDFRYREILLEAINNHESLTKNGKLYEKVKRHFRRYPSDFKLWLFLDNHDLNRILFECGFDKDTVTKAIRFTEQWQKPFLMFYGTETDITNTKSIFDGTPYADERVRIPLTQVRRK